MKLQTSYPHVFPLIALAGLCVAGATIGMASERANLAPANPKLNTVATLGEAMFYDSALSGSGRMSCATCHDPGNHYAPTNTLPVQMGGAAVDRPGLRAVPSLAYKMATPSFSVGAESAADEAAEASPMTEASGMSLANAPAATARPMAGRAVVKADSSAPDMVPQGGMFWDGRVDSLEDQALQPMISPFEMANADADMVYAKLKLRYGKEIESLFGRNVLEDRDMTISEAGFALARYQIEDPSFHPYSSKYDAYLRGRVQLSAAEMRGLKLFEDPDKGNCSSCHLDQMIGGEMPAFTDFEFEGLGVPRNAAIPANADAHYFDLGICGPLRHDDYAAQSANCGLFKTPTLRNAATRHAFFHNGIYNNLEDVVRFYVRRDTNPETIYPRGSDGRPQKYNDVPAQYQNNMDVIDAPLNRKPGQPPALNDAEIEDIVTFLKTLTDMDHGSQDAGLSAVRPGP